jgi:O-antigen/teichoic acid export membrane protein
VSTDADQSDPPVGLGTHSARGVTYLFASMGAAKVISYAAQLVLAYLLSEDDFGIVALAYTITTFVQVIEQAGVGDVLVQRKNFRTWAIPAFWLASCLGLVSCLLTAAAAPFAARYYENPQLFWILLVLAPASIPNAFMAIPRAQLSRELRFRALAITNLAHLTMRMVMTVALAWFGCGAFSFVLPVPISNAVLAAFLWWWVRPPWSLSPQLKKWRFLIGDSTRILIAELQRAFIDQSDNIMLGLFRSVREVGLYAFGFGFSIQILQLLSSNLMNVLFPALTKLNSQPKAQYQGFLNAQRILGMIGISACLMQAAIAAPLTYLLLEPRWIPSIGVMQILSAGMALRMISGSSYALLKSQGRFRAILWNRWGIVAVLVIGLIVVLNLGGSIDSVAVVVAGISTLMGPITFYTAILPYGAGWRDVGQVLYKPIVCGVISIGTAWLVALKMEAAGFGPLVQLIETLFVGAGLNLLIARFWMRPVWDDFWLRVWRLRPARSAA